MKQFGLSANLPHSNLRRFLVPIAVASVATCLIVSLFPYMQYRHEASSDGGSRRQNSIQTQDSWPASHMVIAPQTSLQLCGFPSIPTVSTNRESEQATVHRLNEWIQCHNQWSQDLNSAMLHHAKQANTGKLIQIQSLIDDDKTTLAWLNSTYTDWKKNSAQQKHRLGFRRNFIDDSAP